jgi:AcrR family transcriptional regulator
MRSTKQKILTEAEKIFAENGFYNTSMREITRAAGVNLSAINYHFGSKENLFENVITRRLVPINKKRIKLLEELSSNAKKNNSRLTTKEIINAFFDPVWELMQNNKEARNFLMIIGSIFQDPDTKLREKFITIMHPVAIVFFENLCESIPTLPKEEVLARIQLAMGSFHHGLRIMFIPSSIISIGETKLPDSDIFYKRIIEFILRGMGE